MISTFLVEHSWLPAAALLAVIVGGPVIGYLISRRRRFAWWLTGISLIAVLAITIYPESRTVLPGCEISLPTVSLGAVESLANIILFVPPVLFAGVASRRLVVATIGGIALSAGIELLQLAVPVFGRSCDTSDWITNSIGAAIGGLLAILSLRVAAFRRRVR